MAAQSFSGNTKVDSLRPEKTGGGGGPIPKCDCCHRAGRFSHEILMHCVIRAQKMKRTPST